MITCSGQSGMASTGVCSADNHAPGRGHHGDQQHQESGADGPVDQLGDHGLLLRGRMPDHHIAVFLPARSKATLLPLLQALRRAGRHLERHGHGGQSIRRDRVVGHLQQALGGVHAVISVPCRSVATLQSVEGPSGGSDSIRNWPDTTTLVARLEAGEDLRPAVALDACSPGGAEPAAALGDSTMLRLRWRFTASLGTSTAAALARRRG